MPIVDEHQSGVRRYAIFTFVIDDQGGHPGSPALRFPHSPHASSLEVSTRLRHCESFFMKRLKSLEKGFAFPFVDVSFFSSYQNVEEMKRLLEPADCINFHDAAISLQKGCYEEVQLVDPKRDMIQTPIDDDADDDDRGSGYGSDPNRTEDKPKKKPINPPGIQTGVDDYKKTRGYIVIGYKTMEYMYSREFLTSWKTWTGVRYICMQIPRQLGLRRIAFYRQISCTSDFSYVLLIEVTNLLLYAAQTLNLMDRIKLRLCGCAGVFREMDFQVDPVTGNIHHIPTNYRPFEKPPQTNTTGGNLGRLDSVDSGGSICPQSRKCSQARGSTNGATVDSLMQLLKQQEAAARRKAAMETSMRREKRRSLAPPDYPAPAAPAVPDTPAAASSQVSTSKVNELKKETSKAPTAVPESEGSEASAGSQSDGKMNKTEKRSLDQRRSSRPVVTQNHQWHQQPYSRQQPIYHSTTPLHPLETCTAASSPVHQSHPYVAHHHSGTLPMQRPAYPSVYGQILSHPIDAVRSIDNPLQDMITNDYHQLYTSIGKPVPTSPFGFVQPTVARTFNDLCNYNSPIYTRNEWKKESATYGTHHAGDESMRTLAERFRTLKETPIIGSDPYLPASAIGDEAPAGHASMEGLAEHETPRRKRSQSAVTIEYPKAGDYYHGMRQNHNMTQSIESDREQKSAKSGKLQRQINEAEQYRQQIMERDKWQQKLEEAENLHRQIVQAELSRKEAQKAAEEMTGNAERAKHKSEEAEQKIHTRREHRREESPPKAKSQKGTPDSLDSPKSSPKRRQLPKLPPNADSPVGQETEVRVKHKGKDEHGAITAPEKHPVPAQPTAPPSGNGREESKDHRSRRRSKDTGEKTKEKEQVAIQPAQKLETAVNGHSKDKGSADQRERRAEEGQERQRRRSSAANGKRHVPQNAGAVPVPLDESNGRHEAKAIKEQNESRSRSRELDAKEKASTSKQRVIADRPSTSATPTHLTVQAVHGPIDKAISRSRSGSRRRRQPSKRRK